MRYNLKIWVIRHVAGTKLIFGPCNISPLHNPSTCPLVCIFHLSLVIVSCYGGEARLIVLTLQLLKQFNAWVKGFKEEKWFIRDNFNKLNDTELKFGR